MYNVHTRQNGYHQIKKEIFHNNTDIFACACILQYPSDVLKSFKMSQCTYNRYSGSEMIM
jgi:hypothetical protein